MPSIGDVIMNAREQFPDIPQTFAAPVIISAVAGSGGNLPAASYYIVVTGTNAWGETVQSDESGPIVVGANGTITITATVPSGLTGGRAYYGGHPGVETVFVEFGASGVAVAGIDPQIGGQPPSFNSAFNPDSDGSNIGAYTMYRWLNDSIQELSRIAGGILDMTGVQASTVQADYVIPATPNPWIRFTDAWFDGYFCQDFKRRNQWRRQFISAISFYWSVEQVNRQMVLNFYPVPNRNGSTGILASGMTATQNTIPMTVIPAGLRMPGMCQIDDEIIIYSTSIGNTLTGAIRGMGGSAAVTHQPNATVTEFNLVLAGFRQPNTYSVGQAGDLLSIPVGWEIPISSFLLARYRNYEQNAAESKGYYESFVQEAKRIAFDSRQFPSSSAIGGPASFLTLYPGGPFGVIVP